MYTFTDGEFQFWTARYGSAFNDAKIVFRVRADRIPSERAKEKNIVGYDRLYPASENEIDAWLQSHPSFKVINQREN